MSKDFIYIPTYVSEVNNAVDTNTNFNDIYLALLRLRDDLDERVKGISSNSQAFPVGGVYGSFDNVNPADKFKYGVWSPITGLNAIVDGKALRLWSRVS